MTKTLYYVNTLGYDFLMTDDGETRSVLGNVYAHCPRDNDGNYIDMDGFLASIEDDSGWDKYKETAEEMIGDGRIVAQVERNDL